MMFVYFPGYGIQMSTIDPEFLIKGSPLGKEGRGWFDAVLSMNIMEKLPTPNIKCKAAKNIFFAFIAFICENESAIFLSVIISY